MTEFDDLKLTNLARSGTTFGLRGQYTITTRTAGMLQLHCTCGTNSKNAKIWASLVFWRVNQHLAFIGGSYYDFIFLCFFILIVEIFLWRFLDSQESASERETERV